MRFSFVLAFALPVLGQGPICRALFDKIPGSTGNQHIGFVIDVSTSMEDNDPNNLRLNTTREIIKKLLPASQASGNATADMAAVVDFAGTPKVLYALGDPSGAEEVLHDPLTLRPSTFIGGGINKAVSELNGTASSAKLGILVLTDGYDDPQSGVTETIAAIKAAGSQGIRVSFAFLAVDSKIKQDQRIVDAILTTGGTFGTVSNDVDIAKVAGQILANGLTGPADESKALKVIPGVETAARLSETGPRTFTYSALSGEAFNVTATPIKNATDLRITLKDGGDSELAVSEFDASENKAVVKYTAGKDMEVKILVEGGRIGGNSTDRTFFLKVESALDVCATKTPPLVIPGGASTMGGYVGVAIGVSLFAMLVVL